MTPEGQTEHIMSNDEDLRRAISALRARNSAEIGPLVGAYVQKHAKNVAGLRLLAETRNGPFCSIPPVEIMAVEYPPLIRSRTSI